MRDIVQLSPVQGLGGSVCSAVVREEGNKEKNETDVLEKDGS